MGISYAYDALGNVVGTRRFGSASDLAYRYTGQEFDGETGLHNFRARLYDSELFRFYATDPADEQHSPYAFVGNSPLMFRDPTGKWFGIDDLIVAGTSFLFGYFSHAISTGDWGLNALGSGGIAAVSSWAAYNTGGAVGGLLHPINPILGNVAKSAVGSAVGSFVNAGLSGQPNALQAGLRGFGGGLAQGLTNSLLTQGLPLPQIPGYHSALHILESTAYSLGANAITGRPIFEGSENLDFFGIGASAVLPVVSDIGYLYSTLNPFEIYGHKFSINPQFVAENGSLVAASVEIPNFPALIKDIFEGVENKADNKFEKGIASSLKRQAAALPPSRVFMTIQLGQRTDTILDEFFRRQNLPLAVYNDGRWAIQQYYYNAFYRRLQW